MLTILWLTSLQADIYCICHQEIQQGPTSSESTRRFLLFCHFPFCSEKQSTRLIPPIIYSFRLHFHLPVALKRTWPYLNKQLTVDQAIVRKLIKRQNFTWCPRGRMGRVQMRHAAFYSNSQVHVFIFFLRQKSLGLKDSYTIWQTNDYIYLGSVSTSFP